MSEPINMMNDKGEFTSEFKDLVDKYVQEELDKVCTNGVLDPEKMLEYIKEHAKKDPQVVHKVLKEMKEKNNPRIKSNIIPESIEYVTKKKFKGVLYDYHHCVYGGDYYQISIYRPDGKEITHAYNAAPTTMEQLKKVVNREEEEYLAKNDLNYPKLGVLW